METLLKFASAGFIYFFVIKLFNKIYPKNKISFAKKVIITSVLIALMVLIGLIKNPVLNYVYMLLSFFFISKTIYSPNDRSYIVYDMILSVITLMADIFSVTLLSGVTGRTVAEIIGNPHYYSAAYVANWILLFVAVKLYLVIIQDKKITHLRIQEFIFFFLLLFGEVFFLYKINDIMLVSNTSYHLTGILLIFLIIDLFQEYFLNRLSQSYELEKKYMVVLEQSRFQLNAYKELNEKYDESRKIIHDVKKHISSLEGLINSTNAETAGKYKKLLNRELERLIPQFECDDPILSVIINDKLTNAEKMNIDFKYNIEFSKLDFMNELDITVIFSNLLDNAFEAVSELPADERKVNLSAVRHNCFMIISLVNSYCFVEQKGKGRFKSTKQGHHGIGLSNVKKAVMQYDGNFEVSAEKDVFKSDIMIPIPQNLLESL